jgi:bis(5'-nucleosyl)-tetraphosphatase (symmetrical)
MTLRDRRHPRAVTRSFATCSSWSAFSARDDRLWLVGDLVNRGPDSLAVLREVKRLGAAAVTVLGNHDLHLLTVAAGHTRSHKKDTITPILEAPDRDELLHWLARRPLVVVEGDLLLVHAGLPPSWTAATAVALSADRGDARERTRRRFPARPLWR